MRRWTDPRGVLGLAPQPAATEYFNATEPTGTSPLSPSRLLEYETWPAPGGRMPPVWLLTVMARLYQTHARNLLPDTTPRPHRRYTPTDLDTLSPGSR